MTEADDEMFAEMIAAAMAPNARALCACHPYNPHNNSGELPMQRCNSCEKLQHSQVDKSGKTLTIDW